MKTILKFSLLMVLLIVGGCSKEDVGGPNTGEGELRMYVVDSPAAYDEVNIVVTRVDVHAAGSDSTSGWVTVNDKPATYDLLKLQNGASAVLGDTKLSVGHYTQIRLLVGVGSNVVIGGVQFALEVSSAMQSGLKLNHQFSIEEGKLYELTLDFDAERSIRLSGLVQYRLNPTIRIQSNATSGSVSGTVLPVAARASVFTMVNSDTVSTKADTTTGAFKLMALPEGSYSLRFVAGSASYRDTTLAGVVVTKGQNTSVGTVTLANK